MKTKSQSLDVQQTRISRVVAKIRQPLRVSRIVSQSLRSAGLARGAHHSQAIVQRPGVVQSHPPRFVPWTA